MDDNLKFTLIQLFLLLPVMIGTLKQKSFGAIINFVAKRPFYCA
jgi:hypothetical protein